MQDIANAAKVSLTTITTIFGTKFMLLDAIIKVYTRGDESPIPLVTRTWWQDILRETDPVKQVGLYAKTVRNIHERTSGIYEIVRGIALVDAEVAAMRKELNIGRVQDTRTVAVSLAAKDALDTSVSVDKALDILWALGSSEMYRMMVVERHWSADEYEAWLAQSLSASLLRKRDKF